MDQPDIIIALAWLCAIVWAVGRGGRDTPRHAWGEISSADIAKAIREEEEG